MIYNTTVSKAQVYTGSAWEDLGGIDALQIEYLVIAGGGGGTQMMILHTEQVVQVDIYVM